MRMGLYRQRITMSAAVLSIDDHGQSVQTWSTASTTPPSVTVWAKVEEVEAAESTTFEGINTKQVLKVSCRYRSTFTSGSRMTYDSKFYNVTSIIDVDGLGIEMRFTAEAIS